MVRWCAPTSLISILLLLQVRGRLTARSLAERLEVSERTVLRDMDALAAAGVPVVADRGPGGGWRLLDNYQTKLTGLTTAEIRSLFFANPPRILEGLGLGKAAEAARLKLEAALPAASQQHALWRGRRVRFIYESGLGETGERLVDPLGPVARGSVWYLVAWRDAEPRTYRLSRIREATLDDQESARPEGFDLAAYWEASTAAFRERLPLLRHLLDCDVGDALGALSRLASRGGTRGG